MKPRPSLDKRQERLLQRLIQSKFNSCMQRVKKQLTKIFLTNEDTCLSHVIGDRESKNVLNKLKCMYKSASEATVDSYLSRHQSINMDISETVMSYVNNLRELENKLAEIGSSVDDKQKI